MANFPPTCHRRHYSYFTAFFNFTLESFKWFWFLRSTFVSVFIKWAIFNKCVHFAKCRETHSKALKSLALPFAMCGCLCVRAPKIPKMPKTISFVSYFFILLSNSFGRRAFGLQTFAKFIQNFYLSNTYSNISNISSR